MDLSKLIVYSVLYRQYDAYIFNKILSSDVIKRWNRLNPANIIDEKRILTKIFLRNVLKKNENSFLKQNRKFFHPCIPLSIKIPPSFRRKKISSSCSVKSS